MGWHNSYNSYNFHFELLRAITLSLSLVLSLSLPLSLFLFPSPSDHQKGYKCMCIKFKVYTVRIHLCIYIYRYVKYFCCHVYYIKLQTKWESIPVVKSPALIFGDATFIAIYLPIYLSTYLSTYLSIYLPIYLSLSLQDMLLLDVGNIATQNHCHGLFTATTVWWGPVFGWAALQWITSSWSLPYDLDSFDVIWICNEAKMFLGKYTPTWSFYNLPSIYIGFIQKLSTP